MESAVKHFKNVVHKLCLLKRIRPFLPTQSRIQLYITIMWNYLEYCCSIWGSTYQENTNVIGKLQKGAAVLFRKLKWFYFSDIFNSHQLSLVFKCIYLIGLLPFIYKIHVSPEIQFSYLCVEIFQNGPIRCRKKTHQKFVVLMFSTVEYDKQRKRQQYKPH